MKSYAFLPLVFLKFWYFDSPRTLFGLFTSLNKAALKLLSLPMMIKTYAKPLKNEYREGLVRFSKIMGVIIKSVLIAVHGLLFLLLVLSEIIIFTGFLAFPVFTVLLLFWQL